MSARAPGASALADAPDRATGDPQPAAGEPPAPEAGWWHPVLAAASLPPGVAVAVRLLACDLVLWRDAGGEPQALADRCPHRGTRLSLGRIVDGAIECAYHGWRFDASGRCTLIPALPQFVPPAGHRACRHAACETQGLVWVRLADGEAEPPRFAADGDRRLRKLLCGPYEVRASAPRIVENFLDLSHFGFVHERWLGTREHAAVADHRIEAIAGGFAVTGCRAWQPRSNRLASEGSWVDYRYELTGPYAARLIKLPQAQGGYRDEIGLYVCPADAGRSIVWFRLAMTDFDSTDDELRAFQHTIFGQDQPILESQTPALLPVYREHELHSAADRASAAYRRWLREQRITFGTC